MDRMPEIVDQIREAAEPGIFLKMIDWIVLYSVRDVNTLFKLDDFMGRLVNAYFAHKKLKSDKDRISGALDLLKDMVGFSRYKYDGLMNLFIIIDKIPDNLIK